MINIQRAYALEEEQRHANDQASRPRLDSRMAKLHQQSCCLVQIARYLLLMAFLEILNVFKYISKHIGPLVFYSLKYTACSNNTVEQLKIFKKLFWAKPYFLLELQANAFVKNKFIKLKNNFYDCLSRVARMLGRALS